MINSYCARVIILSRLQGAEDREEDTLFGKEASPHHLSRELANVQRRQEALAQALANARAREAKRQPKKGSSAKAKRSRP